jgi:hypothetical protein
MYALVLIDVAPEKIDSIRWLQLLESIQDDILPNARYQKVLDNARVLDLNTQLTIFCDMLAKIRAAGLSYKVSFFENEPKFTE